MLILVGDAFHQLVDGLGLISGGVVISFEFEHNQVLTFGKYLGIY